MTNPDTSAQKCFALDMKARRESLSLSQHKLAALTGLSDTTINRTETSKKSSDLATLEKIAFALMVMSLSYWQKATRFWDLIPASSETYWPVTSKSFDSRMGCRKLI
ncbi:helix-turn-helix transcriptional regulator [Cognatiyoonia sp. IB215182]|uniref:helix-turn-helix domain-containing protein n=1 Tax=Cognatiyoonia sp. IB215182 TaxID=3097353 RepID=UPI002A11306E|nr:helix-turn-helix transcriptional regulator [Cognatiyoonia sp. IB215182]MDX8355412.1 helix-turn-helix transcriptional regulator [Cognatiyoonia sp. IB215182]